MASIYQRGATWWLSWYEDGELKRKSLKTKSLEVAEAARDAKEIFVKTGVDVTKKASTGMSFAQLSTGYLGWHEEQYPASTERIHGIFEKYIGPFFGKVDVASVKPDLVAKYKSWRRNPQAMAKIPKGRTCASATLKKEVDAIYAAMRYAVSLDILPANPLEGKTKKKIYKVNIVDSKPPRWFTVDELQAIYEADPEFAPYYKLIANTGIRQGEMYLIDWTAIKFNTITLVSTSEQRTKSGKYRQIPLSPGAKSALEEIRKKDLPDGLLFPRMGSKSWSRRFRKAVTRAGIPHGVFHNLRHTFCSHLAMKGKSPQLIKELAGHSKIETTMKYIHLHATHLAEGVEDLDI